MTKREFFNAIKNGAEITAEMKELATKFIEQLDKDAARKTPKQRENENIKSNIVQYLDSIDGYETAQQIAEGISEDTNSYSRSKVSALCSQLEKEGRISTVIVKVKGSLKHAYGSLNQSEN